VGCLAFVMQLPAVPAAGVFVENIEFSVTKILIFELK
jgi:hypothetical protein